MNDYPAAVLRLTCLRTTTVSRRADVLEIGSRREILADYDLNERWDGARSACALR
jgi:hypothetical protein